MVVLFDDECLLCNRTVQWLLCHDKHQTMCFASLHSKRAEAIRRRMNGEGNADTVLVVDKGRVYSSSRAIVQLLWTLGGGWRVVGVLLYLVPSCVRDACYRVIARNRYRWFGRGQSCVLLSDEERWRLLS